MVEVYIVEGFRWRIILCDGFVEGLFCGMIWLWGRFVVGFR